MIDMFYLVEYPLVSEIERLQKLTQNFKNFKILF